MQTILILEGKHISFLPVIGSINLMKNLLIYTGANKKFGEEDSVLAKIQIDNSFDLGWKKEDIMLVTDFAFAYNGIQSMVIPDGMYYDFDKNANKIPVVVYLIKNNL